MFGHGNGQGDPAVVNKGMEDKALEFLTSELVGQRVNCFRHRDDSFSLTYEQGGSIRNWYLLTGCISVDEDKCTMFSCNGLKKLKIRYLSS
jgi:hypothetical protein